MLKKKLPLVFIFFGILCSPAVQAMCDRVSNNNNAVPKSTGIVALRKKQAEAWSVAKNSNNNAEPKPTGTVALLRKKLESRSDSTEKAPDSTSPHNFVNIPNELILEIAFKLAESSNATKNILNLVRTVKKFETLN
ncbi:hypothetical protein Bealeia1_00539 [Candidatus Bealeia paramacronuclearis]|uniref:Uncharacterized protein n=1 Tax=Candidatus Bealeia paramacronuclearis TaxID=1921001 RepID=A0ABZ2C2R4_9PROT|nr:hypothetical protein [Candidatus Bealeia paramacronuclearis]